VHPRAYHRFAKGCGSDAIKGAGCMLAIFLAKHSVYITVSQAAILVSSSASLRVRKHVGTEDILDRRSSHWPLQLGRTPQRRWLGLRWGRRERPAKHTLGECGEAAQDPVFVIRKSG
jgi:hypothetical protein